MPSQSRSGKRVQTGVTQPGRAITTLPGSIAPIMAAPSPRVLWAALNAQIELALWLRAPLPALSCQIDDVMRGGEFDIVAQGTPDDIQLMIADQLPLWRGKRQGPLASDVSILATLFSQLSGASCVQVQLQHIMRSKPTELDVEVGDLLLLCTYAGRGVEWQDITGTVRRMPKCQVGLFKGRSWPDDAIRVRHRQPTVSHLPPSDRARLILQINTLKYM